MVPGRAGNNVKGKPIWYMDQNSKAGKPGHHFRVPALAGLASGWRGMKRPHNFKIGGSSDSYYRYSFLWWPPAWQGPALCADASTALAPAGATFTIAAMHVECGGHLEERLGHQ